MIILQTPSFARAVKKLNLNQKADLDAAVHIVVEAPDSGEPKKGDLEGVRVYKFRMNKQRTLLAYSHQADILTLTLLALGPHENFYRDLK
jgi:mRNA-degrading endonuclease RelE of RelBE toxin-antitoxin system